MPAAPTSTSYLGLYRDGLTGPDHRRHITVGRTALLDDALAILRKNAGRAPKHHQLFIGPRGVGKTHLLSLIADEIERDSALASAYRVVRFPEESNRTLSFADFLLGLCEILRDSLPDEPEWAALLINLAAEENDEIIVDTLVPAIRARWRRTRQALVVMFENLNELFDSQIKDRRAISALRGFFMEENGCLLIATAPIHFDAITDVGRPFYDFFDIQVLDQLTEEETIALIRRNLEWEKRDDLLAGFAELRPRLLAIYRMTGGNPRLSLMLYELIAHEAVSEVKRQFHLLLDRITPFYQDRLRDLPPQERALLETMAVMRDQPKTPSTIAARMRMKQPQVSALLGRLTKGHYLRSLENPDDKRSRFYVIREGFFDIWLAMNVSRGQRRLLPFLLDFFVAFYPDLEARNRKRSELRNLLADEKSAIHSSIESSPVCKVEDAAESLDYLSEIGSAQERAPEKLRLAALHTTRGEEDRASLYVREARGLVTDPIGGWIVDRVGQAETIDYLGELEKTIACWEASRAGGLEAFAAKLSEMADGLNFRSWSEYRIDFLRDHVGALPLGPERITVRLKGAGILSTLARWSEAENEACKALAEAEEAGDLKLITAALNEVGGILKATSRFAEAELLVRRALEIDEQTFGSNHYRVATDLNNLAQLLHATNRIAEAEPLMRRALQVVEQSFGPRHPNVTTALNNLSVLLQETNRHSEAEPLLLRALEIDEYHFGAPHPAVAIDLSNLAQLLQATNRFSEAEPLMRRALEVDEQCFGLRHPTVGVDLNNLAQLLQKTNRLAEAEPLMRRALEICEQSYSSDHPAVAAHLNNLAHLLKNANRLSEAELLMRRALEIDERNFDPNHPAVARDLNNLAFLLKKTKRHSEAEPLMRRNLEIFLKFTQTTGREHPHMRVAIGNYVALHRATGRSEEQIRAQLNAVAPALVDLGLQEGAPRDPSSAYSAKKKTRVTKRRRREA